MNAIEHVLLIRDARLRQLHALDVILSRAVTKDQPDGHQPDEVIGIQIQRAEAEIMWHQAELAVLQWEAAAAQAGAQLAQQIAALKGVRT